VDGMKTSAAPATQTPTAHVRPYTLVLIGVAGPAIMGLSKAFPTSVLAWAVGTSLAAAIALHGWQSGVVVEGEKAGRA
jgi:hypothetical protein